MRQEENERICKSNGVGFPDRDGELVECDTGVQPDDDVEAHWIWC
jgi:hypothetical protein